MFKTKMDTPRQMLRRERDFDVHETTPCQRKVKIGLRFCALKNIRETFHWTWGGGGGGGGGGEF